MFLFSRSKNNIELDSSPLGSLQKERKALLQVGSGDDDDDDDDDDGDDDDDDGDDDDDDEDVSD